ncbi:MAG: hypothetical protein ABJO09_11055 [Hyphomicrobiales bacterium]
MTDNRFAVIFNVSGAGTTDLSNVTLNTPEVQFDPIGAKQYGIAFGFFAGFGTY